MHNMLRGLTVWTLVVLGQVQAQDAGAVPAAAAGDACTFSTSLPWTYETELTFQLSNYMKQKGVLELQTTCTIPVAAVGQYSSAMTCTGTLGSDCDPYAQSAAYFIAAGEKFGSIFLHMEEKTAKGSIAFAFFWAILGTIFVWLGLAFLLYSEIKAVVIFREKDERAQLIRMQIIVANEAKMKELDAEEDDKLAPRPYLTVIGILIFSVGMFFQWLPLCDVIGLIFPGYFCIAFVFLGALLLSITAVLFIVGLCWSCTRSWAALVLIVLSLVGNVLLFGGILGIVIFLAILTGTCYAYFAWAPNYYAEQKQDKPEWLQSLGKGDFYYVALDAETFKENMTKGARGMTAEGRDFISSMPAGKKVLESADRVKALADEAAENAKKLAAEQQARMQEAAAKIGGGSGGENKPPQSGSV